MVTIKNECNEPCTYNVKWESDDKLTLEEIRTLLRQNYVYSYDVTLACDGKFFLAHKLMLSLCSDYFKEIFAKNCIDNSKPILILGQASGECLHHLIKFMYQGQVDIPENQVTEFFVTGQTLKVKGLINQNVHHEKPETFDTPNPEDATSYHDDIYILDPPPTPGKSIHSVSNTNETQRAGDKNLRMKSTTEVSNYPISYSRNTENVPKSKKGNLEYKSRNHNTGNPPSKKTPLISFDATESTPVPTKKRKNIKTTTATKKSPKKSKRTKQALKKKQTKKQIVIITPEPETINNKDLAQYVENTHQKRKTPRKQTHKYHSEVNELEFDISLLGKSEPTGASYEDHSKDNVELLDLSDNNNSDLETTLPQTMSMLAPIDITTSEDFADTLQTTINSLEEPSTSLPSDTIANSTININSFLTDTNTANTNGVADTMKNCYFICDTKQQDGNSDNQVNFQWEISESDAMQFEFLSDFQIPLAEIMGDPIPEQP